MRTMFRSMASCLFVLFAYCATASVKPNSLFTDHMVLQRGVSVPVWGTAAEGEEVTVQLEGQKLTAKATGGKWMVKLSPLKAGGPYVMTVSGENIVTINDILVGEVWICSGQSNMERKLGLTRGQKPIVNWEKEKDDAAYPQIRQYMVPRIFSKQPLEDAGSKWVICSPEAVTGFSAVGYFFARNLHKRLSVPVGILFTAFGGTPAEYWTSEAALQGNPELVFLVNDYNKRVTDFPAKLEEYRRDEGALLAAFVRDSLKALSAGTALPKKPAAPSDPSRSNYIAGLYNGMLMPLKPYAIKGFTWYQGESNNGMARQYEALLRTLIDNWRSDWANKDLPFLVVQIAPHQGMTPELRESQLLAVQKTKNTALIVTTDCGDSADIHPAFKQPVGERLALAANALAYQEKLEYSGPLYQSVKIKGNQATLSFTHTGKGLRARNGELKGFTIAGADKQFVPARAEIKGDKVIVYSESIAIPVAVRYGWSNVPHVNLYNAEGLPASPFRTDME